MNQSETYLNTLKSDEYVAHHKIIGTQILLESELKMSLPYMRRLRADDGDLKFLGRKVTSFGIYGDKSPSAEILYYKNDSNFVLRLIPKNPDHEIILSINDQSYRSMNEIVTDIANKIKVGKTEHESGNKRYELTYYDIIDIPNIGFNIKAKLKDLIGASFSTPNQKFTIKEASQKTLFFFDHEGVMLESQASYEVVFAEMPVGAEPRKMVFDKPFFIMIKRRDSAYPYFGLWVENTELMK